VKLPRMSRPFTGILWLLGSSLSGFAAEDLAWSPVKGLYLGGSFGPSYFDLQDKDQRLEGIDFQGISIDDDDIASRFYLGYWITPYLGVEIGGGQYGRVLADFAFSDPRNGRVGTGESDVEVNGSTYLLQAAYGWRNLDLFAKAGILSWSTSYDSRFDVVHEESQRRTLENSGTSLTYGVGASVLFAEGWSVRADADFMNIDEADVQTYTLGLQYDFTHLWR